MRRNIGLVGLSMPSGKEEYSGYTINWDTSPDPDTQLWRAQAGVVAPPDHSGVPSTIHGITGEQFKS